MFYVQKSAGVVVPSNNAGLFADILQRALSLVFGDRSEKTNLYAYAFAAGELGILTNRANGTNELRIVITFHKITVFDITILNEDNPLPDYIVFAYKSGSWEEILDELTKNDKDIEKSQLAFAPLSE